MQLFTIYKRNRCFELKQVLKRLKRKKRVGNPSWGRRPHNVTPVFPLCREDKDRQELGGFTMVKIDTTGAFGNDSVPGSRF